MQRQPREQGVQSESDKSPAREVRKSDLSPDRKLFLEFAQWINHGTVLRLRIRGGEPVMHPTPRHIRRIKFGGENGPRPELVLEDFALPQKWIQFFEFLDNHPRVVVHQLAIAHGIPQEGKLGSRSFAVGPAA